jgi:hypothetical protein
MTRTTELLARLRHDADDVLALRPTVVEREPWPLAPDFGASEGDWGVREVLAHLAEMIPYWTDEAGRILAGPSEPAPFGRLASDEVRVAIIGRERSLPASVLFERIADEVELTTRRLGRMSEADLSRQGVHPRRGPMSVGEIVERFVADHLAEHAAQLRDILARPSSEG